jgi:hypothetical protein
MDRPRWGWAPKAVASDAAPVEYLYVPCARIRHHGQSAETRRWVQAVPIVKKTGQWIYYASNSWNRREAVVSPGRISREQFETATRGYPAGVIPVPGDRHLAGPSGRLFFATRQAAEHHLHRGGTRTSQTGRTASGTRQAAAPRHGRRPPRPRRHR